MEKYFAENLRQELRLARQEKSSGTCLLPSAQIMPFRLSHNAFKLLGQGWHGRCFRDAALAGKPKPPLGTSPRRPSQTYRSILFPGESLIALS